MTRTERKALKKKMNRQYWLAYTIGLGGTALYLFIMFAFIAPIEMDTESTGGMFGMMAIILSFILPACVGLGFGMSAGWKSRELLDIRKELYSQQNKLHMKFFWDAIQAQDYKEARRLYNLDKFIWGSERVLCNGILMGVASVNHMDQDWKETVNDRMNSYLV